MYYKFDSIKDFNTWHESVKSVIGLPLDDGITTDYTSPLLQEDGSVIAFSDEEYAQNLTLCQYKPITLEYTVVNEANSL